MRTFILIPIFMLLSVALSAAILTVNNTNPIAADYSSIAAAIAAASAGDTIFIHPTGVSYGDIYLPGGYKPLVYMGGGFAPLGGTQPASIIGNVYFGQHPNHNYSNIVFIGFRFNGAFQYTSSGWGPATMSNVQFFRCMFTQPINISGSATNYLFTQCLFNSGTPTNTNVGVIVGSGHIFMHCIFVGNRNINQITNASNIQFVNCSFYKNHNSLNFAFQNDAWNNVNSIVFKNCIFDNQYNLSALPLTVTFENCLVSGPPDQTLTAAFLNSRSINGENIEGAAVYANYTPYSLFSLLNGDMTLMPGSPGKNAGDDGFDVGPFGGSIGFVKGGLPPIPFIEQAVSLNNIVPADQTLQIKIKAQIVN